MHLFLIRHGECLAQIDPAVSNHPDTPLSPRGEQQAVAVAARVQGLGISHIVSSPLVRALSTANCLAEATGHTIDVWPELREGWLGRYQGFARQELIERFPRAMFTASMLEAGWTHPGDDTYEALFDRAQTAMQRVQATFGPDDRIAIVTHGGMANYLLHALLQMSPATPQWFELANGSISHVRLVPDPKKERPDWPLYPPVQAEVWAINDISHLAGI